MGARAHNFGHDSIMTHAQLATRKRKFHHKGKGACDRCRERHVRCGLEKPVCHNCRHLGLSCDWRDVVPALIPISMNADELSK
jgi:hypothetical protein